MDIIKAVVEKITEDRIILLAGEEEKELFVARDDARFPENLNEGDWVEIEIDGDQVLSIKADEEETDRVKKRIQEKMDLLRKRSSVNRNDDSNLKD